MDTSRYDLRRGDAKPLRALMLATLLATLAGPALAQSSFEESMRLGRRPPPEDPTVRRDSLDRAFPRGKPQVASPWLENEMRAFSELLKAGKYDVMVAPINSDGYAIDRISRSLILAELSKELAARKLRVPNPVALSRALGEGKRRVEVNEFVPLANALSIERVVIVGVAHDRQGRMTAAIRLLNPRQVGERQQRPLVEFSLGAGEHPSAMAKAIAPAVLDALALPGKPAALPKAAAETKGGPSASPAEAMAGKTDPARRAADLQLIASLAPEFPERGRERLFEQALIAAQALPRTHPHSALFIARAWYHLEARQSALAALGTSTAPEALAYREFLNGNLPDLAKAVPGVKDVLARLLLEIDLKTLQAAYERPEAKEMSSFFADVFLVRYPAWVPLVERRLQELDPWFAGEAALVRNLLDRDLALPGASLDGQMTGLALTGKARDLAGLTKLTLRHIQRVRREHPVAAACLQSTDPCVVAAYLDLLEAIAISNPIRELHRLVNMQVLPAQARDLAEALKPELDGHPAVLTLESGARLGLARQARSPQGDAAFAETIRLAVAAAMLEQGQSKTSFRALAMTGIPGPPSAPFLAAYQFDIPVRSYWYVALDLSVSNFPREDPKMALDLRRRQLEASVMDLDPARWLTQDVSGKEEVRTALEKRFRGHPERASLLQMAAKTPAQGREAARAEIQGRPDEWAFYADRARRLIDEQGDYEAAAKMYLQFPGFADPSRHDPVELARRAYAAGSVFFWQGRFEETRPLYGIAAKLNTGSGASLASQQRLAQLDGDYATMLEFARHRGERYNDSYGWRDFVSWLFVLGRGEEAWAAFGQLHNASSNPQVWLAADVGLRMKGGEWNSHKQWLLAEPHKSSSSEGTAHGLRLALMLSAIDRSPSPDLLKTLRELAGPPNTVVEGGRVLRPPSGGQGSVSYPRSAFRAKSRGAVSGRTMIESDLVYFAEAYVELRRGNFRAAVERFDKMAEYYPVEGYFTYYGGYALPYFAWASAKSGDPLSLEPFVRGLTDYLPRDFDRELALAFFAGLRREHDAALKHLRKARDRRPFTDKRPIFPEYQLAEACEWLYSESRDRRYLEFALDWARRNQGMMPVNAWAYALEARHSTDEQQRLRATAIAHYLDPKSERLASVPAAFRKRAEQWFGANNPFKVRDPQKDRQVGASPRAGNTLLQPGAGRS